MLPELRITFELIRSQESRCRQDELGMMSNPELALNYHYPCDLDGPGALCDPDNVLVRALLAVALLPFPR